MRLLKMIGSPEDYQSIAYYVRKAEKYGLGDEMMVDRVRLTYENGTAGFDLVEGEEENEDEEVD